MSVVEDILDPVQAESFEIEEIEPEACASHQAGEDAALAALAVSLARIIQERLDSSEYIVENGVVMKAAEVCCA
jgi:hypothetical protein